MPLDPTIPLGVKPPDVAGSMTQWGQLGLLRNQLQLSNATLQPSITQAQAQASTAVSQAGTADTQSKQSAFNLTKEQAMPGFMASGALATHPAIVRLAQLSQTSDYRQAVAQPGTPAYDAANEAFIAMGDAQRQAEESGMPRQVADIMFGRLRALGGMDPRQLQAALVQNQKIAMGPVAAGGMMFPAPQPVNTGRAIQLIAGGNQAITGVPSETTIGNPITVQQPPGTVTFQDQAGNMWAIDPQNPERAIRVGQGTPLGHSAAPPAQREKVSPSAQASRDAERLRILQDEMAKTTNPSDRASLQREITKAGGKPPVFAPGEAAAEATGRTAAATDMVTHFSALNAAAEQAPMLTSQAGYIKSLIPGAVTGKVADRKAFAVGLLNALGAGNQVTGDIEKDTNLLDKMLAQMNLVTPAATNAMRDLISTARADRKMNPNAISEAVDQLVSVGQSARSARDHVSSTRYANEGAGDREAYQKQREELDVALDPRIWQMQGMSAEKRRKMIAADPALARAIEAALKMKLIK